MSAPDRRFQGYLIVDWSAASVPRQGRDSIWLGLTRPGVAPLLENPATRVDAAVRIADILVSATAAGERLLVGCDFAFGLPEGSRARLCPGGDWDAWWDLLAARLPEGPGNANGRFDAAGAMNAAFGDGDGDGDGGGPFWANGLARDIAHLPRRLPAGWGTRLPPRLRRVEMAVRGAQEVWKLAGAGAVGSQALTGLATLARLRADPRLAGTLAVWPFETGLALPDRGHVLAEVFPSLLPPDPREGVRDAGQVRALGAALAALDALDALAPLFAGPTDPAIRAAVVAEEGWILGAGHEPALRAALAGTATAPAARHATQEPSVVAAGLAARVAPAASDDGRSAAAAVVSDAPIRSEAGRAADPSARPCGGAGRSEAERRGAEGPATVDGAGPRPVLRYLRDPDAIYARSFATLRSEARLDRFPPDMVALAERVIHACGMIEVADRLSFSPGAGAAGVAALRSGARVLCDCEMVAAGVIRSRLPAGTEILSTLNDPRVPGLAAALGTTRSAAAVELWADRLDGAVVAIGNAPTALFHLLERLDAGWPRPVLILGFPVGFVGAAESKAELARDPRGAAFVTLRGRRGGSAMAAAAVNALAGAMA